MSKQTISDTEWNNLVIRLEQLFHKKLDLNGVLFLIGVQELGQGKRFFSKEEKQDLMHIAICKVMSLAGYYSLEGTDEEGWPHWKPTKKLPFLKVGAQEALLKHHVVDYFNQEFGW